MLHPAISAVFFVLCLLCTVTAENYKNKVLLVSMDGFRWDYLDQVDETPNFDNFTKEGVRALYMEPSFPTKTFPNHYTIATGLYEESHGITENYMYDPVFNATFGMGTKETRWWSDGEPVWITAKLQGKRTGTYFWPGSETEIRGVRPDFWFPYSDDPPYKERVDTVVNWFKNEGITLATLYYPEPDKTGHGFGPYSPEVRQKVKYMDSILGYLMEKMKDNNLDEEVNVIVTSDHGMVDIDVVNKVVDISDHVNMAAIQRVPSYGPVAQILPVDGMEDAIVQNLTGVPKITVYKKENILERYHYKHHRRIMPIVIIADEGWMITTNKTRQAQSTLKATHGYDNVLPSMRPIFLARGPNFKMNFTSDPIRNVDIYPLICKLMNIQPAPNNGSLSRVSGMIQETQPTSGSGHVTSYTLVTWFFVSLTVEIFQQRFQLDGF